MKLVGVFQLTLVLKTKEKVAQKLYVAKISKNYMLLKYPKNRRKLHIVNVERP